MRIYVIISFLILICSCSTTKETTKVVKLDTLEIVSSKKAGDYRAAYTRYFDLIHTKLNLNFDWKKNQANGKATISLHPHFYLRDSLNLNARGMDIHDVRVNGSVAKY